MPACGLKALYVASVLIVAGLPYAAAAQADSERVPVSVETAQTAPVIEQVPITGTVTSPRISQLSASVSGLVSQVHVEVGDRVDPGAALVTLDPELDDIALQAARARTREAQAELADAKRRLADAERLVANNNIAKTEVRSRRAQVEIAQAALERLQAEQRRQAALLARHELSAPYAGIVSRKLTHAGEWVTPGTPVLELVSTKDLRIDFRVPQEYYPRIDSGTQVRVRLDAMPGRRLEGHISATVPMSDSGARTFLMRVRLREDGVAMIPGMSAHAQLRLATGKRGVVVPRDALLRHPDGRVTVWIVEPAQSAPTVTQRRVRLGRSFAGKVEIAAGLEAGTSVVVRGNEGLREGQPVRIRQQG